MNNADKKAKLLKASKYIISLCIVILIVFILFTAYFRALIFMKGTNYYYNGEIKYIEIEGKNMIDVILLGSSHALNGYNPQVLWDEYGIASYNMGTPAQTTIGSYYMLLEALTSQTPKLVVMDSFYAYAYAKYRNNQDEEYFVLRNIHNPSIKKQYVDDVYERIDWLRKYSKEDLYSDVFYNHDNWKNFDQFDFLATDSNTFHKTKGFTYVYNAIWHNAITPVDFSSCYTDQRLPLVDVYWQYTQKIIDLCRSKNIDLVFTNLLYGNATTSINARKNTFIDNVTSQGIPFFDSHTQEYYQNFNWQDNFINVSHLNALGAVDETRNLGQYITNHYNLPNRSQDSRYRNWSDDFTPSRNNIKDCQVVISSNVKDAVDKVANDPNYVLIGAGCGSYTIAQQASKDALSALDVEYPALSSGGRYYLPFSFIYNNGTLYDMTFGQYSHSYTSLNGYECTPGTTYEHFTMDNTAREVNGVRISYKYIPAPYTDESIEIKINSSILKTIKSYSQIIVYSKYSNYAIVSYTLY